MKLYMLIITINHEVRQFSIRMQNHADVNQPTRQLQIYRQQLSKEFFGGRFRIGLKVIKLQIFCAALNLRQTTHRIYQITGEKAINYLFYQSQGLIIQKCILTYTFYFIFFSTISFTFEFGEQIYLAIKVLITSLVLRLMISQIQKYIFGNQERRQIDIEIKWLK
ncbi:unnamed protein product (macronuclear) [Paramecium tetraurelia]|uniref:Transmembrane protein n=1 Tax=Paramecium tetraurelia TaxID=5888 RepID=A0CFI4_PARTE|nr:uncharacterized protein GSPATT00037990001 [Paramecium tetraurelia]CAK69551.1 unnamed protein product [Paramecium tetraurelia]|eukprot:XP_001436948.1 hypothetical protein (macronuclear) [Paramecium tetraurelia strain d4-2]